MTLATEKLIITIHILPNLSKGKGNLTLKLGQFIECKMTNYFPESRFTKYDDETSSRPLYENRNGANLLINSLKFCSFYCVSKSRTTKR